MVELRRIGRWGGLIVSMAWRSKLIDVDVGATFLGSLGMIYFHGYPVTARAI